MKTLPAEASDEEILDAVREWVGLLAEERYKEAYDFVVNPEHNPWHSSPQILEKVIRSYGSYYKQEIYRVTPLAEAVSNRRPNHDVHRYRDGLDGYVWFDLPLNGKWSDLIAVLTFRVNNERLVIELESIEVM